MILRSKKKLIWNDVNLLQMFLMNYVHHLTTMRSYLEALADGAWKDENIAPTFLNVTQTETERMIRLVNDLLQLIKNG